MSNTIIKSFAKKSGKTEKEVEKLWDEAKKIALNEYPNIEHKSERYYKVVTGILKKMLNLYGLKEQTTTTEIPGISKLMGKFCFDCEDNTFWHLHQNVKEPNKWRKKFYQDMNIGEYAIMNPGKPFFIKHRNLGLVREIKFNK